MSLEPIVITLVALFCLCGCGGQRQLPPEGPIAETRSSGRRDAWMGGPQPEDPPHKNP